jgi:hypothetical protein
MHFVCHAANLLFEFATRHVRSSARTRVNAVWSFLRGSPSSRALFTLPWLQYCSDKNDTGPLPLLVWRVWEKGLRVNAFLQK